MLGAASQGEQPGGHPAGQGGRQLGDDRPARARRARDGSHGLCWSAGSVEATQVSLLVPSPRLEITSESAVGADPGEAAGQQAEARGAAVAGRLVGHGEGPQHHRTGHQRAVVVDGGHRGGGEDLLADPVARAGPAPGRAASSRSAADSSSGRSGRGAGRGLHGQQQQVVEPGQDVAEALGPPAPPALGPAQGQLLAEQGRGHVGQQSGQGRALEDPRAEGVEHGHPAAPDHLEQAGHPEQRVGPQLDGSHHWSSTRRMTASTGSSPASDRSHTRLFWTTRSRPSTSG